MDISEIEAKLGFKFPEQHRLALLDKHDPIHEMCDFLLLESKYEQLNFLKVNEFLHQKAPFDLWPDFLIAFASNGCGDYYAYDIRTPDLSVIYIDPDLTVGENLEARDRLKYDSFDIWYESKTTQQHL